MDATTINSVLDNVAAKLAVPATELLSVVPTFGVETCVVSVIGLCGVILGLVCVVKGVCLINNGDDTQGALLLTLGSIPSVLGIIAVLANLSSTILWLYDPKAWAVKYLLKLFS